jgi:WD40 repeat protein
MQAYGTISNQSSSTFSVLRAPVLQKMTGFLKQAIALNLVFTFECYTDDEELTSSDATSAGQVASLGWFNHILTSSHSNGSIVHHDVRVPRHVVATLQRHVGEVCKLCWSPGGEVIVSSGNDNIVNLWDGRGGDVGSGARSAPKWMKRTHTAAVKVLVFSL